MAYSQPFLGTTHTSGGCNRFIGGDRWGMHVALDPHQQGAYLLGLWGPLGPKFRRAHNNLPNHMGRYVLCAMSMRRVNIWERMYSWFSTTWARWPNFAVAEPPCTLRCNTEYYDVLPIDWSLCGFFFLAESTINPADPMLHYASTVHLGRQLLRHMRACVCMTAWVCTYLGAPLQTEISMCKNEMVFFPNNFRLLF